jgi:16S rRNA (cytidine1402-2'-O)-methyltransferase
LNKLYLVATPLGNLEDMTHRAVRILKEVSLIAAEDTRTSKKLLSHYNITTQLTSYHDHNKEGKTKQLLDHLSREDLALISDAGTPGINDPGYYLIREALKAGIQIIPVPGPSAPITALSASGLPTDRFCFCGYLPNKSNKRREFLKEIRDLPWTLIFLEAPGRLQHSLEDCLEVLGNREMAVARELTKLHEEILRGSVKELINHFENNPPRGEITLVISGQGESIKWTEKHLIKTIKQETETGQFSPSQLAKSLADLSGWSRRDIYDLMQRLNKG